MNGRGYEDDGRPADLDELIAEITVDAYGDDEQLWAFLQVFSDEIALPCDMFVIGEPVSVVAFDYDGNQRRGLTARCRRQDSSEYVVAVSELALPARSSDAPVLAAYRKWSGLSPLPEALTVPSRRTRQHKVASAELEMNRPIELVVLSPKQNAARCRPVGSDRVITLRGSGLWDVIPGEIVAVNPLKQWSYAGHPYLHGAIESARLDVAALELVPLKLHSLGMWSPEEHYWGEENDPIEEWVKPIIDRGPRQAFEMEQIVPGVDPADFDSDPICESSDLKDSGDRDAAQKILEDLCQVDLRCLDAHAHLGNFVFDQRPEVAIRHYEVGVRIGELSLGTEFEGVLQWGHIDNRPFLRCLHGYGLCLWRLNRFEEAGRVFDGMLWLNPHDNQGVRFLIDEVRTKSVWEDRW